MSRYRKQKKPRPCGCTCTYCEMKTTKARWNKRYDAALAKEAADALVEAISRGPSAFAEIVFQSHLPADEEAAGLAIRRAIKASTEAHGGI